VRGAPVREPIAGDPNAPFYDGLTHGTFQVQVCGACERSYWPASCCIEHGAAPMAWRQASARGTVETFTVFHRAYRPGLAGKTPYVVAVVRLDAGPYFHTNIVGCDPSEVHVGQRLEWVGPGPDADAGRAVFRPLANEPRR
jgi:uncharacterized OB-fold protein